MSDDTEIYPTDPVVIAEDWPAHDADDAAVVEPEPEPEPDDDDLEDDDDDR